MSRRVAVIGAGAAGSMAAIFAASLGAETMLLERTADGGRKILISGGGRCNILPAAAGDSRFVTDSAPALVRALLRSWPLRDQVSFFEEELRLPLVEETESAKLFPASQRARDVRDGLLGLAARRGVRLLTNTLVTGFTPAAAGWRIDCAGESPLLADAVVVATGGRSVPKTGSDGLGLDVLERLGHTVHETYPALTPITIDPAPFAGLAGLSVPVTLTARAQERTATATGGFLFTHRGYSGPAVLDVSHVLVRARASGTLADLLVRWSPLSDEDWRRAFRPDGSRTLAGTLRGILPDRLARTLIELAGAAPAKRLSELRRDERTRLTEILVRGTLPWTGDGGYERAEVTGGGISLAEVFPKTMESRRHRGLFLCGEVLDAFGPIGGYNFQWAWATGRAAGLGAARAV